jgi:hypothetical protein
MAVFHEQGLYRARIANVALTEANNDKRTPQVELELDLQGMYGSDGTVDQNFIKGRFPPRIFISITEATMGTAERPGWAAETLKFLGFDGDFGRVEQLQDMEIDAYCSHGQNLQGKDREQWSVNRPRERKQGQAPEKKQLRVLNSKFAKLFKSQKPVAAGANGAAPAAASESEPAGEAPSDDIPF